MGLQNVLLSCKLAAELICYQQQPDGIGETEAILVSSCKAARAYAEGWVLNSLEFLNKGRWGVAEPNGSCIYEKQPDKGHIGDNYGFLLLTPVGASKGHEDVDMGQGLAD